MKSVPFSEAFRDITSKYFKIPKSKFLESGSFPIIDQGRGKIAGHFDDVASAVDSGEVVIFGDHTRAVKFADGPFALGADGTKVLKPVFGLFPRYAYRWLEAQEVTSLGYSRHFKLLKELSVPVCDEEEQRRIAEILDEADALRAKRREAIAHLDALGQSVFHEMFGSPVGPSFARVYARLDDLGTITTGNTPPRSVSENYGEALEWVKTDNVNSSGIGITQAAEGLSYEGMKKARIVESGSILMTCIAGSPRVIGNVALADRRLAFNQQINAFTPTSGEPYYWLYLLMAMKPMVQRLSTGGMTGLVSKSSLSGLEVPVQDENLQEVFAHRVSMVENLKSKYRAQLGELDNLFLSLQDRAFKGEL